jgi:hypothetical protein
VGSGGNASDSDGQSQRHQLGVAGRDGQASGGIMSAGGGGNRSRVQQLIAGLEHRQRPTGEAATPHDALLSDIKAVGAVKEQGFSTRDAAVGLRQLSDAGGHEGGEGGGDGSESGGCDAVAQAMSTEQHAAGDGQQDQQQLGFMI